MAKSCTCTKLGIKFSIIFKHTIWQLLNSWITWIQESSTHHPFDRLIRNMKGRASSLEITTQGILYTIWYIYVSLSSPITHTLYAIHENLAASFITVKSQYNIYVSSPICNTMKIELHHLTSFSILKVTVSDCTRNF